MHIELEKSIVIETRIANRGNISADEIKQAYIKAFEIGLCERHKVCFHLADETYSMADPQKIKEILETDATDKMEYVPESVDCDDFAFRLMGIFHEDKDAVSMPIFLTWVLTPEDGHAVLSYCYQGQITIIEPQNDLEFPVPEDWKLILIIG